MFIAQIETLIETAQKGATLSGQALIIIAVLALAGVVVYQYKSGQKSVASIIAAMELRLNTEHTHHVAVVETYKADREAYGEERANNFQLLLKIAAESTAAIREQTVASQANTQALKTAIDAQAAATQSLRNTMHGINEELHSHQLRRELDKS